MASRVAARVAFVVALLIGTISAPASAQEDQAAELRRQGNEAMQKLEYAQAVDLYKRALALTPNAPALYYNIGRAEQALADYPAALDAFEEFNKRAPEELKAKVQGFTELLSDLRRRVVTLNVRCSAIVEPARVILDSRVIATTCSPTAQAIRVSAPKPGTPLEIRLESDRYNAASKRVVPEGGKPTDVDFELLAKATSGLVRIQTTPSGAQIYVDGTPKGNPPLELVLPLGSHTITAKRDQYEDATVSVVAEADRAKDVPITLQQPTPIYKKWWFWTAIGVVVAGATTIMIYAIANTEKDPDKGSIDPGLIRAPAWRF